LPTCMHAPWRAACRAADEQASPTPWMPKASAAVIRERIPTMMPHRPPGGGETWRRQLPTCMPALRAIIAPMPIPNTAPPPCRACAFSSVPRPAVVRRRMPHRAALGLCSSPSAAPAVRQRAMAGCSTTRSWRVQGPGSVRIRWRSSATSRSVVWPGVWVASAFLWSHSCSPRHVC